MTVTCASTRCCLPTMTMLAPTLGWAVTPSAGCWKTLASGSYQVRDQNVRRTYRVFVPSGSMLVGDHRYARYDRAAGSMGRHPLYNDRRPRQILLYRRVGHDPGLGNR